VKLIAVVAEGGCGCGCVAPDCLCCPACIPLLSMGSRPETRPVDGAAGLRRVMRLELLTIFWMVVEALAGIGSGIAAGSAALVGFGLDSVVEVFAAVVVVWQLRGMGEERERSALRLIAVSFFLLAAYVGAESLRDLVLAHHPEASPAGIVLAAAAIVLMPLLARAKKRAGEELGSATVVAESSETRLCAYLSAALLAGLALNAVLGWWWADPLAGLGIAAVAAREGREAWRGDPCCNVT